MAIDVVFRSAAKADLNGINDYIAKDSPQRADDFVDLIEDRCQRLAEFPEMGRLRSDLGLVFDCSHLIAVSPCFIA